MNQTNPSRNHQMKYSKSQMYPSTDNIDNLDSQNETKDQSLQDKIILNELENEKYEKKYIN